MLVTGLENFKLTQASFRKLGKRNVLAYLNLRTHDLTPAVRRLPPRKRLAYMAARADQWIREIYRLYPHLSFQKSNRWAQVASTLTVHGHAREILGLIDAPGVSSIHIGKIAGHRR